MARSEEKTLSAQDNIVFIFLVIHHPEASTKARKDCMQKGMKPVRVHLDLLSHERFYADK